MMPRIKASTRLSTGRNRYFVDEAGVANFEADLTLSLNPRFGFGLPTFTRATTATVEDFENLIKKVKANENRFEGARRVENLIPTPSNTLDIAGTKTITVIEGTYVFSMGAGASSGVATFSGTSGATGTLTQNASKRTSKEFTLTAGTFVITGSVAALVDLQFELTTGQAISIVPSEYISVGILVAPFHGANVDGVKYFATQNGNTVESNVVTEATGASIPNATLRGNVLEGAKTNLLKNSSFSESNFSTYWRGLADAILTISTDYDNKYQESKNVLKVFSQAINHGVITTTGNKLSLIFGTTYTVSAFVKGKGTAKIYIGADSEAVTYGTAVKLTDFWQKITCSYALPTINRTANIGVVSNENNSTIYVSYIQAEASSSDSSYIPTTTVAATRNAEIIAYPVASNINTKKGSLYLEFIANHAASETVFMFGSYVDDDNYTAILHDATNLIFRKRIAAINYDATIALYYVRGNQYKIAATWNSLTGTKIYLSGVAGIGSEDTSALQLGETFQLGSNGNSQQHLFGEVRNFKIWNSVLTDTQLISLTK